MEERADEKNAHKRYNLEAERGPVSSSRRLSADSGSRAWGQASHRRLTESEADTAERQEDDWVPSTSIISLNKKIEPSN